MHWLHFLQRSGVDLSLNMDLAGFYPQGGGRIISTIRPCKEINPLILQDRGEINRIYGVSAVANLDLSIAKRQKTRAVQRLLAYDPEIKITSTNMASRFKGTMLLLIGEFLHSGDGYAQCCYFSLGSLGKPAELVADEAVDEFIQFYATPAAIDQYLADQLLLPLALASGESLLYTSKITSHLLTNAAIIQAFGLARVEMTGSPGGSGLIKISPTGKSCPP